MNRVRKWSAIVICLAVGLMIGYIGWAQQGERPTGEMTAENSRQLQIGDGTGWSFLGGQWTEDEAGVIRPEDTRNLHSRAFYTAQAFEDLVVEFEFNANYRELGAGQAGVILRAADSDHFYFVYFPWQGQQLRAKHFWAAIAKVEGDGYLRNLKAVWVPGVPSEVDRWYKVRVEAQGPEISVWVDGRFALSVTDESYSSGCLGLGGYGWYFFRNVRMTGTEAAAPAWNNEGQLRANAFTIGLDSESMPTGCVAPNGDVLIAGGSKLVRSSDKGHTWGEPVELPEKLGGLSDYGSTMFCTSAGRLVVMIYRSRSKEGNPVPEILMSESADNGYTWSDQSLRRSRRSGRSSRQAQRRLMALW